MPEGIDQLGTLRQDGTAAFTTLVEAIGGIREGAQALQRGLGDLGALAAPSAGADLADLGAPVRTARDAFAAEADPAHGEKLRAAITETRSHLDGIRRKGVYLTAVASITRTTAASMGLNSFDSYVENLPAISGALTSAARTVLSRFDAVTEREAGSAAAANEALRVLDDLAERIARAEREGSRLDAREREVTQRIGSASEQLVAETKAELGGLVRIIQFADQMDQRLDHVGQIAATPGLNALAAAQLAALAGDLDEILLQTDRTVDRLSRIADRAGAQLEASGVAGTVAETLAQRRAALDDALERSRHAADSAEAAREGARFLESALAEAAEAFDTPQANSAAISMSSINSMLLASRSGEARGALQTLSVAVREAAGDCMTALELSRKHLARIEEMNAGRSETAGESVDRLIHALESAAGALDDGARKATELERLTETGRAEARALAARLTEAETGVAPLRAIPDRLRAQADRLSRGATAPDPDQAAAVLSVYTMDCERAVHREVTGDGDAPPVVPQIAAGGADMDIDSIFF